MNSSPKDTGNPSGDRIAFIQASWHSDMTDRARDGFTDEMKQRGFDTSKIDCFRVPGAFEIPLTAMKLIASERYAAVIACGFVVDGGIYRHDFVASAVVDGLMRVQLDTGVPVFSVVLTPHHFHETEDHTRFFREHMIGKGREAAGACLDVLALEETLAAQPPGTSRTRLSHRHVSGRARLPALCLFLSLVPSLVSSEEHHAAEATEGLGIAGTGGHA